MNENRKQPIDKEDYFFFFFIAFLLLVRLISVRLTPLQLGPDEAQYWRWGETLAWGYYSKPPMISWLIAFTTGLFGDSEWAIRLTPPFFYAASAILIYLSGRLLWSSRIGILAGATWSLMGGVWLSATIMSTDVALLTFWSLALYALLRLRTAPGWGGAVLLGLGLGLGFLSKYAMIYFLIGMALGLIYDKPLRSALISKHGGVAMGVFLAVFAPHIVWSVQNGFKTVSHTADNANWGGDQDLLNPGEALGFIGDQFGVFSPMQFLLLLVLFGTIAIGRSSFIRSDASARLLLAFILPPLLIITVQAFISRAHANWAASAYPAASLVLAAWIVYAKGWFQRLMYAGLLFNMCFGLFFSWLMIQPFQTQIDLGGNSASKRLRGWPETVEAIAKRAEETGATAIIVDERELWHGLDYYGRDGKITLPIKGWRKADHPKSASEEAPITDADAARALILNKHPNHRDLLVDDFVSIIPLEDIDIDLQGGKHRHYTVFLGSGFNPKPRTPVEE